MHTTWDTDEIVALRDQNYAASQRAFVPYKTPLNFSAGRCSICGMKRATAIPTFWA